MSNPPKNIVRHPAFPSTHVQPRHVDVYLPPAYAAEPDRRFGVLYMQDGQNVFDPQSATYGVDWGVVPALEALVAAGDVPPVIIVGIWSTERRMAEYLPRRPFDVALGPDALRKLPRVKGGTILSDAYLRLIVEELKPFVDAEYRTLPGREHTHIMGSSMGGLISLYALCEYPHLFAGAGCVSTHWPAVAGVIEPYLRQALPPPGGHRLYFDYGTAGLDSVYERHQLEINDLLRGLGYRKGRDFVSHRYEGADHNEASWRARVDVPLRFLLGSGQRPGAER